jgi:hypothetical protein
MTSLAVADAMAKQRNDVSVKIDAEVYRLVKTVAAWRGITVAEYLTDIVKPAVARDWAKIGREAAKPQAKPQDS